MENIWQMFAKISGRGDNAIMKPNKSKDIIQRIEKSLGLPSLADKLANELSQSDFNSLLTEIFAARSDNLVSGEMLKLYSQNQYAKPALCNAAQYRGLEAEMLLAAEEKGAQSIILSPAALFGCCSVFGAVSQNKVISAARNLEILSDATNMLALYIAAGLKAGTLSHVNKPIHMCTTHRHIRYQAAFAAYELPHFGVFTMVSAGKSQSSYAFEIESLLFHLRYYHDYWLQKHGKTMTVEINRRTGYKDADEFFARVLEALKSNLPDMAIVIDEQENDTTYYKGLRAVFSTQIDGNSVLIGDIGFTDWTQKLLNSRGERLLISSMALDRQMLLL